MTQKLHKKFKVSANDEKVLIEFLHQKSGLSKSRLKIILNRGGVWLERKKKLRIRRAQSEILAGDKLEIYDDPSLTVADMSEVYALEDGNFFGVWYKPAGVFSQGTPYGDEGSMMRLLEKNKKQVYLIHRIDRETAGLIAFAYDKKAAATLSEQFSQGKIKKVYQAEVLGIVEKEKGTITTPLEGKEAITHFEVVKKLEHTTLLKVEIETGRLHQIRKHLNSIGHPVMGDPKYGKGNKNESGLKLIASELTIPWSFKNPKTYVVKEELRLF